MLSQKGSLIVSIGIIVLLVLAAGAAYYLGTQKPKPVYDTQSPTASIATSSYPSTQVSVSASVLPPGWEYQTGKNCNVNIPLPPKKEPYFIPDNPNTPPAVDDEGGFWQIEDVLSQADQDKFFKGSVMARFRNPDAGGHDYVAGIVQVICGPNTQKYSTDNYIEVYSKQFTDGTFQGLTFSNLGTVNLWGKEVVKASIEGGMSSEDDSEYFFATPETLYRIRTFSQSQLLIIQDTTQKIFENLQFP